MTAVVDLLYVPDYPNAAVARERVVEAAAAAGVTTELREQVVADAAGDTGVNGSPRGCS